MRNFFKRQSLPPIEDLFSALLSANNFLHPEWTEQEVLFNSSHVARNAKTHKQFANKVNDVCELAVKKLDEVATLEQQFQLSTDINN
jgi:hypothetical protein